MRFTCNVGVLVTELGLLVTVAGRKATIVHLNQVHIKAEKDGVVLTATDLDCTFRIRMPAVVETPGAVSLDAKKLHGVAQSFEPKDSIAFAEEKELWMAIVCGGSKLRTPGLDPDDFPKVSDPLASRRVVVSTETLAEILRRAAIGAPESDPRFSTMRLVVEEGKDGAGIMSVTGIDGRRLSLATGEAAPAKIEIPASRRDFAAVGKLLTLDGATEVVLQRDENYAWFTVGDRILTIKLDSNRWPDVQKSIDAATTTNAPAVTVDRKALDRALRRAELVAGNAEVGAVVTFRMADKALQVAANNEMGEVLDTFPVEYEGEPLEAHFGATFIREFLAVATANQIALRMNTRQSEGALFHDVAAKHSYLLMGRAESRRPAAAVAPKTTAYTREKKGAA